MSKILTIWNIIRTQKYLIVTLVFAVYIGFIDDNSLINRFSNKREISRLRAEIEKYQKEYDESTERLKELQSNPEVIEKIARENYLMKKPNEDIFVFE